MVAACCMRSRSRWMKSGLIVINSLSVVRQVAAGGRKFAVPLLSRFSMKALERKPKLLLLLVA